MDWVVSGSVVDGMALSILDDKSMARRTFIHILLHGSWSILFATGSLVYLAGANSSPEINVWGARILVLMAAGLAGSLLIQRSWWGAGQWGTARFWLSWWAITFAGVVLGVSVAMQLVPL